ncbi:hypothetical protein FLL45_01655 [Aliikangiella marina]|uniref:DUF1090 family protein n=1 Tax=Aliikangiella marina TaxID=1712262 RepID=A0A545THK1_9GAMM|nr:hypothetical protein [Aliikangiella marina]TQV76692.1 hypothetical protein FLL45_01655 [Aliikangiella marina]
MRTTTSAILSSLLFAQIVIAADDSDVTPKKCKGLDKRISEVREDLRAGYTTSEGERLKKKLKELRSLKHSCRSKNYDTK